MHARQYVTLGVTHKGESVVIHGPSVDYATQRATWESAETSRSDDKFAAITVSALHPLHMSRNLAKPTKKEK